MQSRLALVLSFMFTTCGSRSESTTDLPVFTGMCDASGAVPLSDRTFAAANDEDNVIRIYDAEHPGAPIHEIDLSDQLGLPVRYKKGKKKDERRKAPEVDLEAATRVGDLVFWVTSHGRSASGKTKDERMRLFATTLPVFGGVAMVGRPYTSLIAELSRDPRYAPFALDEAEKLPPKEAGGLNIEGMTARREGGVYIGFRNPVTRGKALIATLLNPERVVAGEPARFGDPISLDLEGRGVRDLSMWRGQYLLIAGDYGNERIGQVYAWDGAYGIAKLGGSEVQAINPEGVFSHEKRTDVLLLSDDGTELVGGIECKKLKRANQKRFRAMWLPVDAH
jgi:hypothetical protein